MINVILLERIHILRKKLLRIRSFQLMIGFRRGREIKKSIYLVQFLLPMHEALIRYFNNYANTPLSTDDVMTIESAFIPKKLRKRQYLLQEGEVCKYTDFIVRGAMRQYSVDDKGEEHITRLYIENWWATDRESLMKQTPSVYFIDTWEDTECLLITGTAFMDLVNRIPTLSEWIRNVDLNFAIASQRRLNAAI